VIIALMCSVLPMDGLRVNRGVTRFWSRVVAYLTIDRRARRLVVTSALIIARQNGDFRTSFVSQCPLRPRACRRHQRQLRDQSPVSALLTASAMPRMIFQVAVIVLVVGVNPVMAQPYGNLPLAFEPNQGQSNSRVKFLSRGGGYTVFFTETEAVLALDDAAGSAIRASLIGAAPARIEGADPLSGHSNYIIGNDPRRWQIGVPQFGKVRYNGIYPGIDLLFYGISDSLNTTSSLHRTAVRRQSDWRSTARSRSASTRTAIWCSARAHGRFGCSGRSRIRISKAHDAASPCATG
jgi:hypothetical protein